MTTYGPVNPAGWTAADYANFGDSTYFDLVSGSTDGLYVDDSDYQTYGSAIRFSINVTGMLSVTSATLTLDRTSSSYSSNGANGTILIKCEDTVSAAAFASGSNPYSRTYRAATVGYAFPLTDDDVNIDITTLIADLFSAYGAGAWTINISFGANVRFSSGTAVSWRLISGNSSGPAPSLTIVGETAVTVAASAGGATGSGQTATIRTASRVAASAGSATGAGSVASTAGAVLVGATAGSATGAGAAATLLDNQVVAGASGSATGAGSDATITIAAGTMSVGQHELVYIVSSDGDHTKTTPSVTTTDGSTIVCFCAVGETADNTSNPPTDTYSNVFTKVSTNVSYSPDYPNSSVCAFAKTNASGGAGYQLTKTIPSGYEETVCFVEVIGASGIGSVYSAQHVVENPSGQISITTTGPAVLVCMISGWGYETSAPSVTSGWTIVEDYYATSNSIQMTVATRVVESAGTYPCAFDLTPDMYANLIALSVIPAIETSVAAGAGSATGAGTSAGVVTAQRIQSTAGAASGSGTTTPIRTSSRLVAGIGSANGAGQVALFGLDQTIVAEQGDATGVGASATITDQAQISIVADPGSAVGAGAEATLAQHLILLALYGSAVGSGYLAVIRDTGAPITYGWASIITVDGWSTITLDVT